MSFKEEYENLEKSCILGANVEPTFALEIHGICLLMNYIKN